MVSPSVSICLSIALGVASEIDPQKVNDKLKNGLSDRFRNLFSGYFIRKIFIFRKRQIDVYEV